MMVDYKKAIKDLDDDNIKFSEYFYEHSDTIRLALRIADRIVQEPSQAMIEEWIDIFQTAGTTYEDCFRAMVEQMVMEKDGE